MDLASSDPIDDLILERRPCEDAQCILRRGDQPPASRLHASVDIFMTNYTSSADFNSVPFTSSHLFRSASRNVARLIMPSPFPLTR